MKKEEKQTKQTKIVSIKEAAELSSVTRQAIYVAIKLKKLKALKKDARWMINLEDLENYRKEKYSRLKSTFNGELLFDNKKGFYSVNQVAKLLEVPAQQIYYATRSGLLKAERKGAAWVIHMNEITVYKNEYLESRSKTLCEA